MHTRLIVVLVLLMGWTVAGKSEPENFRADAKTEKSKKHKVKTTPLAKVKPRLGKEFDPPKKMKERLAEAVEAYKRCFYGANDPSNEAKRIERALEMSLSYRSSDDLSGTPEKLGAEICLADAIGLKTFETQKDIDAAKGIELVEIKEHARLEIANGLPSTRHFARPWVKDYLDELTRDMESHFADEAKKKGVRHIPARMRVTSFVRDHRSQKRQRNSIASCQTEICSIHTTGSALDFSNNPFHLDAAERAWLRDRLMADRKAGRIIMIEEWFPPHFHVFVLPPEYLEKKTP